MKQYLDLLEHVLKNGTVKENRTGINTVGVFGYQMRFNMADGLPLLTTKRMFIKGIVHELLWFIAGNTNIKYLVDNGISLWTDWPLKNYNSKNHRDDQMTKEWFENAIHNNSKFAKEWGELGPVYGKQWRDWETVNFYKKDEPWGENIHSWISYRDGSARVWQGIDQLQNVIDQIRKEPMSRRLIVSAWNPADIDEMAVSGLPPCHCFFQFNCRPLTLKQRIQYDRGRVVGDYALHAPDTECVSDKSVHETLDNRKVPRHYLDLMLYQRSADIFLGVPFNIASYALLLHMIAEVTNTVPGEFVHTLGDAHIYENHLDQVKEQLTRSPKTLPILNLTHRDSIDDFCFEDVKIEGYTSHSAIKGDVAV